MAEFVRLAEVVNKKKDMRVVSVTVAPTISDCSGRLWITDIQLQEGPNPTGYAPHTETLLEKYREDGEIVPPRFYNGLVRSSATVVIFNLGSTSAGLDVYVYPLEDMKAGSVGVSQGAGGQRVSFPNAIAAGDELALKASTRECLKNGNAAPKEGFFQYSAAWDSKHPVTVEDGKSARLYVEFQEMQDGGELV